jgi:CheY-like chemotaxis protein
MVVAADSTTPEGPSQHWRVLIVEDNFLEATFAEEALTEVGIQVIGITNSLADSVGIAKTQRPDLIVMDVQLGAGREGIDAALAILWATGIRCIFATAHADARTRSRAAPANPFGWLAKPYTGSDLVGMVRKALSQQVAPQDTLPPASR